VLAVWSFGGKYEKFGYILLLPYLLLTERPKKPAKFKAA